MGRNHDYKAVMEAEVMEAAAAARQLVELRGDDAGDDIGKERKEEERDGHGPSTPPAIGCAPSGRRRDHLDDDNDDDDKEDDDELGRRRRKRYLSIRTIYRRAKPILMEQIVSRKRKR